MKLYFRTGACSLASRILLEEIGAPYQTQLVSKVPGPELDAFMKLNPIGAVPVLELDDGNVITENTAILPYLAEKATREALIPAAGTLERVRFNEALGFLASEVHKAWGPLFGLKFFPPADPAQRQALHAQGSRDVQELYAIIEQKLRKNGPYLLGSKVSAVDFLLFVFTSWGGFLGADLSAFPTVAQHSALIAQRPTTQKALKAEGLA